MRPRPEGRGERQWRSVNASRVVASMRPQPEGRGEPPAIRAEKVGHPNQLQCGHNPKAVENGLGLLDFGAGGTSFNAATTRRPWRTDWTRFGFTTEDWLQCGHDPKAVENLYYAAILTQHGTCFNAATTRRPWRTSMAGKRAGIAGELQCGHNPKAVENECLPRHGVQGHYASMRPRPEGRGEL